MFFLFVCFKKHIFLTFSRAFLLPQLIPPTHPPNTKLAGCAWKDASLCPYRFLASISQLYGLSVCCQQTCGTQNG